jgi:hypothetical protein
MQLSTGDDTHTVNRLHNVSGCDVVRVVGGGGVSDDECELEKKRTNCLHRKRRESIK